MADAPPSPLATPLPWDLVADAYEREVVPMFEQFSWAALEATRVFARGPGTPPPRILDVACGPGTLAIMAARRGAEVDAVDFSPQMVERCAQRIQAGGVLGARVHQGDGQSLIFADATFDAAFSMFGLMFFPDRAAGYRELFRVLAPGGRAAVSSWQPLAAVPLFVTVFGAIGEAEPSLAGPSPTPPLTTADDHRRELAAAGFVDIEVQEVRGSMIAPSTAELWQSFQRTNAPVVLMQRRLGAERWAAIADHVFASLVSRFGEGPQTVIFPAWIGIGARPR
ncbi:MAG: class I SAM-dependent methyltransferase [Myxococcota bacterium]